MIPDEIEKVALLGWHVFPASKRTRAAAFTGAHLQATTDLDKIEEWNAKFHQPNWRVVFGPSCIWGLDVDAAGPTHASDGIAAMRALVGRHGPLPQRPTIRSGGGGLGLIFAHRGEPIIGKTGVPAPGIDPRRGRLSLTLPPSIHVTTGRPYTWAIPPWRISPPSAPKWLLDLVAPPPVPEPRRQALPATGDKARAYAVGALYHAVRRVAGMGSGSRNDTLNTEAFSLARFVAQGALSEAELRDALYAAAHANGMVAEDGARAALNTIQSALTSRRRA